MSKSKQQKLMEVASTKAGVGSVEPAIAPVGAQTPAVDQTTTNANIAALQAKIDALIAAMQVAGLM